MREAAAMGRDFPVEMLWRRFRALRWAGSCVFFDNAADVIRAAWRSMP